MATKKKITRRKTKRKVAGKSAQKRRIPGWIILLSGILFGLIIAIYGYVNGWVPESDLMQKPIAQSSQTKVKKHVDDNSKDLQVKPKKDFDFYETLQEMEVVVDDSDLNQLNDQISKTYILQLGSFKNLPDAESLKAQVAFTGISASIQTVTIKKTKWHRVIIGPYKSGRKADVSKRSLEKNGFDAIIILQK
jgi:cell division protein FtsN